ncbi:MAG: antitoxin component YwqK of YwqJK toxin-antitoxin module [Chlamydiales bacterium]|jgi:antitoxin component YwqK of YwqJK toxin-antitoxin module
MHSKTLSILRSSFFFCLCAFSAPGCSSPRRVGPGNMSSIHIIDRNGLTETVNSGERLKQYENKNFLQPQPFQKITRSFGRDSGGNIPSRITSYHPNGQLKQYLEALNSRANGVYREWYSSGIIKLEVSVIGGVADLNTAAEESWLFDGQSSAWDEGGNLTATINYLKGALHGSSLYYHPNGRLWKTIPYENNKINGSLFTYLEDGSPLLKSEYQNGVRHGVTQRFWNDGQLSAEELHNKGFLYQAKYFSSSGNLIAEINDGDGHRVTFGKSQPYEVQEFHKGSPEGSVEVFNEDSDISRVYHLKDSLKHGEDTEYHEGSSVPKMTINWHAGLIQGIAKTWYKSGALESRREINSNKKNGLSTAWYINGSVMLIEMYENDKLVKGEYFKKDESSPISRVVDGSGTATLYDSGGSFIRQIAYHEGRPSA